MLHTKLEASEPSGSEEEDFDFFYVFYGLNLRPLAQGYLGPWGLCLNKLGKGPQVMLHTKF